MNDNGCVCEHITIDGPRGTLWGQLDYRMDCPAQDSSPSDMSHTGGVLLLSPHPFMGGHMNLPLLKAIGSHIASMGLPVLRFDYGGVGKSQGPAFDVGSAMDTFWKTGSAPQDPMLIEEARCVCDWLGCQVNGPVALVGYSFGAFVATQMYTQRTTAIVLVAPTIAHHNYEAFDNTHLPTLIISGEGDFATGDEAMASWVASLAPQTRYEQIAQADHFFAKSSDQVGALIAAFLTTLSTPADAVQP